jgi:inorganic phosphate transporter, PiT family
MGAGLGRVGGVVHWKVVRRMVIAWVLTLPAAGLIGALAHEGVAAFPSDTTGVIVVGLVALAIVVGLFWQARRKGSVTSENFMEPRPPALGAPPAAPAAPAGAPA